MLAYSTSPSSNWFTVECVWAVKILPCFGWRFCDSLVLASSQPAGVVACESLFQERKQFSGCETQILQAILHNCWIGASCRSECLERCSCGDDDEGVRGRRCYPLQSTTENTWCKRRFTACSNVRTVRNFWHADSISLFLTVRYGVHELIELTIYWSCPVVSSLIVYPSLIEGFVFNLPVHEEYEGSNWSRLKVTWIRIKT